MSASALPNDVAKANTERLKAEGNALHTKGQHKAAYEKYSQAIKEDPGNPIFWSNRAATCLAMQRYMDGAADAQQATILDPDYSKAWARLGTAQHHLCAWIQSIEAWNCALKSLQTNKKLTEKDKYLQVEFEAGLRRAQDAFASSQNITETYQSADGTAWAKAFALERDLRTRKQPSSGFVIMNASKSWDIGIKIMQVQQQRMVNGKMCVVGRTGALEALSDAILCDHRIFHAPVENFFNLYQKQVGLEVSIFNAWVSEGPRVIREQALKRLERFGWNSVRPALSVTVRTWILRGFIQLELDNVLGDWLEMAVGMLEWGRRVWKDVPREQRGTIFDVTFLLKVKRIFLNSLVASFGFVGQEDIVPEEKLQKIEEMANAILDELEYGQASDYVFNLKGTDYGAWAALWSYPRAEAFAALAWREMRLGNRRFLPVEERLQHYTEAAELYRDAAECLPKDDEMHLTYRVAALESFWYSKSPLSIVLPYAEDIAPLVPGITRIWGGSLIFRQLLDRVERAKDFVEQAQEALDKGNATLESVAHPEYVASLLRFLSSGFFLNMT